MSEVTHILSAIEQGEAHAADQLLPLVYEELRKLAAQKLAQEKPGQTLQATALVHEAYLRLVGSDRSDAGNSEQKLAMQSMRLSSTIRPGPRYVMMTRPPRSGSMMYRCGRQQRHGQRRPRVAISARGRYAFVHARRHPHLVRHRARRLARRRG